MIKHRNKRKKQISSFEKYYCHLLNQTFNENWTQGLKTEDCYYLWSVSKCSA